MRPGFHACASHDRGHLRAGVGLQFEAGLNPDTLAFGIKIELDRFSKIAFLHAHFGPLQFAVAAIYGVPEMEALEEPDEPTGPLN